MVINHFMTMNPQTNQMRIKKKPQNKIKEGFTRDSMLNRMHKKDMTKNYRVKLNDFLRGTSATMLENIDQLVKSKPDCLIVHAGTNDLANGTNLLNQVKKNS